MSQDMTSTDKTTSRLLTELSIVSSSVQNRDWSTGGLASLPEPGDFGALISSANPLANLASSGVGMLTPHVSFLGKPLEEFRGDSGAVSTPAQGMATAGADIGALADTFRQSSTTETNGWTGEAADGHRITASQFAEGITAIAEAAKTISGAIIGAGEEVVKALTEIVRLIGEAVGKMVPIMADGIARAPMTMGASIGEAIGACVAIATEYGGKISTVMGNLLANGMNLMKLVNMVLTIVHAVAQLLQKLAKLAEGGGDTSATKGTQSKTPEGGEDDHQTGPAGRHRRLGDRERSHVSRDHGDHVRRGRFDRYHGRPAQRYQPGRCDDRRRDAILAEHAELDRRYPVHVQPVYRQHGHGPAGRHGPDDRRDVQHQPVRRPADESAGPWQIDVRGRAEGDDRGQTGRRCRRRRLARRWADRADGHGRRREGTRRRGHRAPTSLPDRGRS